MLFRSALSKETEEAVAHEDFEKAANLRDQKKQLQNEMAERRKEWEQKRNSKVETVGEEEVAEIVSSWTGIPVKRMTESEAERLMHLEDILHRRVIGQEEAVKAVSKACLLYTSGGLGAGQRAAIGQALAGEYAFIQAGDALVLTVEVADLAAAHADVAGGHVDVLADVAVQLGHEALAEGHDFLVGLALGVKVRAALAAADGQTRQRVLEDLLKAQEFDD